MPTNEKFADFYSSISLERWVKTVRIFAISLSVRKIRNFRFRGSVTIFLALFISELNLPWLPIHCVKKMFPNNFVFAEIFQFWSSKLCIIINKPNRNFGFGCVSWRGVWHRAVLVGVKSDSALCHTARSHTKKIKKQHRGPCFSELGTNKKQQRIENHFCFLIT